MRTQAQQVARQFGVPHVYADLRSMLAAEQLHILDICTPPRTHAALALDALQSGLHVLIEKPMAVNTEECDAIIRGAGKAQKKVCVAHSDLFYPSFRRARQIVANGEIGDLKGMQIFLSTPVDYITARPEHWAHRLAGGVLGETGPHVIYMTLAFVPRILDVSVSARKLLAEFPWSPYEDYRLGAHRCSGNKQYRFDLHNPLLGSPSRPVGQHGSAQSGSGDANRGLAPQARLETIHLGVRDGKRGGANDAWYLGNGCKLRNRAFGKHPPTSGQGIRRKHHRRETCPRHSRGRPRSRACHGSACAETPFPGVLKTMCGISGIASNRLSPPEVTIAIARMTQVLRHRGPDGTQTRTFQPPDISCPVSLGHNRLAIIDVSAAGREPMCNEDESVWLVFNGEIYNFPELRTKLEAQGHNFRSRTDAEVIIHLYEEEGPLCAAKLNGIFAFAILDLRRDRLLLARDPIGVKPLYYCRTPDHFLFASEIKAILACSLVDNSVNWQAISDYFTYLYVPGPETAFEGLLQLQPGYCLELNLRDLSERLERYRSVRRREEIEVASYDDLKSLIRDQLSASVKRQLVSDVPLGVFLSGGVDSTIVAGLAKQQDAQIRTFTVIFEGEEYRFYNEAETSRAVSRHLGTDHHELIVSRSEPADVLDLVEFFDQPFGNPTSYLMYLLSQTARKQITVALCGAGGDELFAGYPRYNAVRLARRLGWMPRSLLHFGSKALEIVRDSYRTMHLKRARKFLEGLHSDFCVQYAQWTYFLNEEKKGQLLLRHTGSSHPRDHLAASPRILREALEQSALKDVDNRILHMDLQTFLVDNILEYTDKMSMAVGLEVRVPLLDPEFVELSLNTPFGYKIRSGIPKMLLSDTFADFFPPVARAAPKKGFNAPLAHWIVTEFDSYFEASRSSRHPLRRQMGEDIGISWREGILDWNFIERLRQQHRLGQRDNSYELFSLIVFDVWWRKYVARTSPMRFW